MHALRSHQPSRRFALTLALLTAAAGLPAATSAPSASNQATLTLNGSHQFRLGAGTTILVDGKPVTPSQLAVAGGGFNTQVFATNTDASLSNGDAVTINLHNMLKGPVTSTAPLAILAQPVTVNGDTQLIGLPAGGLATVGVGDVLEVSGFSDINGSLVASRLRAGVDPQADWKLSGTVSGFAGNVLHIGAQAVDVAGVTPLGCTPALADGQFVEIETVAQPNFSIGATLGGVIAVSCEDPGFDDPPGGEHTASLEGLVASVPDPPTSPFTFVVSATTVVVDASTQWRGGSIDSLAAGVRVEVEGVLDAATSTLNASEVRFVDAAVSFTATLAQSDVIPGVGLTILGNSVGFSAQTRDDDGIAAQGISSPRLVEVRAGVDALGNLLAARVRKRNSNGATTILSGPVAAVAGTDLTILGVTIDSTGAVFRDADNLPISPAAFFAQVQAGMIVKASGNTYSPATHRLVATEIELEDDAPAHPATTALQVLTTGVSRGTITQINVDQIFGAGFD